MKRRTGYLFKRGNNFYVSWKVNGKLFMKALRDDNGQPITTKREAEIARDKFMLPITTGDEASVLKSITGKLEDRKAELAKWEDEKHPPLIIGQTWHEFLASPNRPDSGDSTLRQYEFQWQAFADWMKEKHADLSVVRDVTKEISEEYATSLNHGKFSAVHLQQAFEFAHARFSRRETQGQADRQSLGGHSAQANCRQQPP